MRLWKRGEREPGAGEELGPLRDGPADDPREIAHILREAARRGLPVLVIEPDSQVFVRGTVETVSRDVLTVALPRGTNEKVLRPLACCGLMFNSANGSFFFLQTLCAVHEESARLGSPKLVFNLPDHMGWVQRRFSFRVPVFSSTSLEVLVESDGKEWRPTPIDISMSGVLVEFEAHLDPDLEVGHDLGVVLRHEDDLASLRSQVRRRFGHRYGLYFPEAVTTEGVQPPDELRSIVKALESAWLRRRAEK